MGFWSNSDGISTSGGNYHSSMHLFQFVDNDEIVVNVFNLFLNFFRTVHEVLQFNLFIACFMLSDSFSFFLQVKQPYQAWIWPVNMNSSLSNDFVNYRKCIITQGGLLIIFPHMLGFDLDSYLPFINDIVL